ncbi:MAG: hypothetical protein ABFS35_15915, partial [Bacteroidota bacterium]
MKRFITVIIILGCISGVTFGQVPNQIQYQAVIRDGSGTLITDKLVAIKISILRGSNSGTPVYSEEFNKATSEYGIVSLNIGGDSNFSNINWSNNIYYLRVDIDIDNGDSYQFMGSSQIMTVPYALQALNVTNKDDADANPSNELQTISKNGNNIILSNGGGSVSANDADASITNEIQDLVLIGNTLAITNNPNANPIDLAQYIGTNTDNQTLSTAVNENIVTLSITGEANSSVNINLPYDFVSRHNGGTFTGSIFATNLSGTNTGDMDNADVVSAYQSGVDHYYTTADDIKLATIENFAKDDMSSSEIVAAYQSGYPDYFGPADHTKLENIETGATADLSIGEIVAAYQAGYPQYFNNTTDRIKLNRLTLANNFTVSGGHTVQLNSTANTTLTMPTNGTLATESFVTNNAMTNTLIQGRILIGNSSNIATDQTISRDATLAINGELTINSIDGETINLGGSFTTTTDDITLNANAAGSNVTLPISGTLATQTFVNDQVSSNNSTYTGNNTIVTLGTIGNGIWNAGAVTSSGAVTGSSIVRAGGTSSQFLKANGSVDENTYLTSFTESDPVFALSPANGIASGDITNWDNAFGWGNHASAGYLTAETD